MAKRPPIKRTTTSPRKTQIGQSNLFGRTAGKGPATKIKKHGKSSS